MARLGRLVALISPTPIAIHDDRQMIWSRWISAARGRALRRIVVGLSVREQGVDDLALALELDFEQLVQLFESLAVLALGTEC